MLIMPSFKKSLIVEQFQGNYLKLIIKTSLFTKLTKKVAIPIKDLHPVVTIVCHYNVAKTIKSDPCRLPELTIIVTQPAKRS